MADLNQQAAELKTLLSQFDEELKSLQTGKKASAPRARSSLQKIKTLSHTMRSGVMSFTKELPTKTRAKKAEAVAEVAEPEIPPPPVLERVASVAPVPVVKRKPVKAKIV